jgi:hypothetical protein
MPVAITATVLSTGTPPPIQVVVTDMEDGDEYTIVGAYGNHTWPVPGGRGTSNGDQLVLTDNRAPLNGDIDYIVTIAGVPTQTASTVRLDLNATTLLQNLTGDQIATVEITDPRDPRTRSDRRVSVFSVHRRSDPVGRVGIPMTKGMTLGVEADGQHSATLAGILDTTSVIVRRNTVNLRDIPPVEILLITDDSDRLIGAVGVLRRYDLNAQIIADPEPHTALAAYDWDDFDAYWSDNTLDWDDFDAAFASWDEFDRTEWV